MNEKVSKTNSRSQRGRVIPKKGNILNQAKKQKGVIGTKSQPKELHKPTYRVWVKNSTKQAEKI
jgi:hypothetical protein